MIALLLDREFNHSRKCLEVPTREIYGVYSITIVNIIIDAITVVIIIVYLFLKFSDILNLVFSRPRLLHGG